MKLLRILSKSSILVILIAASLIPASAEPRRYGRGEIKAGDHVTADPTAMKHWLSCTVTRVQYTVVNPTQVDAYAVHCNNGADYSAIADTDHVRPGGSGGQTARRATNAGMHSAQYKRASSSGAGGLRSGVYHCIIGFATMLTYGDFHISGKSYVFVPADNSRGGSGTYSVGSNGDIAWHGDIGVINRPPASVFQSGKEAYVANSFYFRFRPHPGTDQTMSCRLK